MTEYEATPEQIEAQRANPVIQLTAENQRLRAALESHRSLLIETFPLIKDMAIAMKYDDLFETQVTMGGELPNNESAATVLKEQPC